LAQFTHNKGSIILGFDIIANFIPEKNPSGYGQHRGPEKQVGPKLRDAARQEIHFSCK
jgi:hypothetical protein